MIEEKLDPRGRGEAPNARPSFKRVQRDERRAAILAVAQQVFFEHGYAAASMSTIAARLGGSKGTLYNYFENKSALFTAYIEDTCQRFGEEVFDAWPDQVDLRVALKDLCRRYIQYFASEDTVRTFRLVVAECQRSPELAHIFNEVGPANGRRRLAEKLALADSAGLISAPDPALAARHFFALCKGGVYYDRLLNLVPLPGDAAIEAEAEGVTATFLRAYAGAPRMTDAQSKLQYPVIK